MPAQIFPPRLTDHLGVVSRAPADSSTEWL